MNRYVKFAVILAAALFAACASAPKFSSVIDHDWNLAEVRTAPANIIFDRAKLVSEGFGEIFTLRFDAERVNGVGAPNRYFAPYTLGAQFAISIKTVSGTLMIPLHEPEKLKERDFFNYLQNAYKWNLVKGNLQLHTKSESGADAVLVFALAGKK